jgi:hypothetical protein
VRVWGAADESWACFLRRSVSSEDLRFGNLDPGEMRVMDSGDLDEEKVIGDGTAGD